MPAANAQQSSYWASQLLPSPSPPARPFGKTTRHERCLLYGDKHDEGLASAREPRRSRVGNSVLPYAISAVAVFASRDQRRARLHLSRRCAASDLGRISHTDRVRTMATQTNEVILQSTITCPECGHAADETMPTDACQWFYECSSCGVVLKPKPGDCCVYCSYGTVACPPIQEGSSCCG